MPDTRTRAQRNKAVRQDALREQLSRQKHVEQVIDITNKLNDADIESKDVARLKVKADLHLALIKKYIPDLKAIEHDVGERLERHILAERQMSEEDFEREYPVDAPERATADTD